MNQILVTEKLYITPEYRKKKSYYKIQFFLSISLVCVLFSYYIYAEYDRNKNEEVSKDILASINFEYEEKENSITEDEIQELVINLTDNPAIITPKTQSIKTVKQKEAPRAVIQYGGVEYSAIGVVEIPKINVNYPILIAREGELVDDLIDISPTKFWGPEINEVGNFCIVGHNYRNSKFFSKVPDLEIGDVIEITDLTGRTLMYEVYTSYIVKPDDSTCRDQNTGGKKEVTLITCTDYGDQRVIVKATQI